MDLSIIIVNYKSKDYLTKCSHSIFENTKRVHFEIIIIDNSDPNENLDFLTEGNPNVSIIYNHENTGLARAINKGMKLARGDYFLILNPDLIFFNNVLEKLPEFLNQHSYVDIATIKILNNDHSVQTCFWRKYSILRTFIGNFLNIRGKWGSGYFFFDENQKKAVDIVTGAFMIMRRSTYDTIGGLDENIFLYIEDTEYCLRALKAGLNTYYLPFEGVIHFQHGSSGSKDKIFEYAIKNRFYVMKKHLKPYQYWLMKVLTTVEVIYRAIVFYIAGFVLNNKNYKNNGNSYLKTFKRIFS